MKQRFSICTVFFAFIALFFLCWNSCGGMGRSTKSDDKTYDPEWESVDRMARKGRPKSALVEVEKILRKAEFEKNPVQVVKSLLHMVRFMRESGQKDFPELIAFLEEREKVAPFPGNAVLRSVIGESYLSYMMMNRYRLYKRKEVADEGGELETWSREKILKRALHYYGSSLEEENKLLAVNLQSVESLVKKGGRSGARPTLFDLLAHRFMDFLENDEVETLTPGEVLADADLFSRGSDFRNAVEKVGDGIRGRALKLFLKLHEINGKKGGTSFIHLELRCFSYLKYKGVMEQADSLYEKALNDLFVKFKDEKDVSLVALEMARAKINSARVDESKDKWALKNARMFLLKIIRDYPGTEGADGAKALADELGASSLSLSKESVSEPGKPFRLRVQFRNLKKIRTRVVKIGRDDFAKLHRGYGKRAETLKRLLAFQSLYSKDFDLPDDGDMRSHSAEFPMSSLSAGYYVVIASSNNDFNFEGGRVSWMFHTVSSLGVTYSVEPKKGVNFRIYDRFDGKLLKGTEVRILAGKKDDSMAVIKKGVSDSDGFFFFQNPKKGRFRYYAVELQRGDDVFRSFFQPSFYKSRVREFDRTTFFTDRSIYRPGQSVHFKAILMHFDRKGVGRIKKGALSKVRLYDANRKEVGSLNLKSNKFGSISGSFSIPENRLAGLYSLENENGNLRIRVEEYKRPRFETVLEPVSGELSLGDRVKVEGTAKSYADVPIPDAAVRYRIKRRLFFPYPRYYFFPVPSREVILSSGISKTDKQGRFSISFSADPDRSLKESLSPFFTFTIEADVTDQSGETVSAERRLTVGKNSFYLSHDLGESVDGKDGISIAPKAINTAGEDVEVPVSVSISKLQAPDRILRPRLWGKTDRFVISENEYVKLFPNDVYRDEDDPRSWERGKPVFEVAAAEKKIEVPSQKWLEGFYLLTLSAKDSRGREVKRESVFRMHRSVSEKYAGREPISHILMTPEVEAGQNAKISLAAAGSADAVLEIWKPMGKKILKVIRLNSERRIVEIPTTVADRGSVAYSISLLKLGRKFDFSGRIAVPFSNRQLQYKLISFRNRLVPGEREQWKIQLTDNKGNGVRSETVAAMYDASLDAIYPHDWSFSTHFDRTLMPRRRYDHGTGLTSEIQISRNWNMISRYSPKDYDRLNLFGFSHYGVPVFPRGIAKSVRFSKAAPVAEMEQLKSVSDEGGAAPVEKKEEKEPVKIRTELQETAFFYPHLESDREGNLTIDFEVPHSLTRWKFEMLGHTEDLKHTMITEEAVTRKELMVFPNMPRFLRKGDVIEISARISNVLENKISGKAFLKFKDPFTGKDVPVNGAEKAVDFGVAGADSSLVGWRIEVPGNIDLLEWKVWAETEMHSDGEQSLVPIMERSVVLTRSQPFTLKPKGRKHVRFEKMKELFSKVDSRFFAFEYASNPVWYAVKALPSLMGGRFRSSISVFNRLYSNSTASHIVDKTPGIEAVMADWRRKGTLKSKLETNMELKGVSLAQTPWIFEARSETEQMKRISRYFDRNLTDREKDRAMAELRKMQKGDGGFPWFEGMRSNIFITQEILGGFGKLRKMGVINGELTDLEKRALEFIDRRMVRRFKKMKKKELYAIDLHYLYTRSFYSRNNPLRDEVKTVSDKLIEMVKKEGFELPTYRKAMAALALHRLGERKSASELLVSLNETMSGDDESGLFFRSNKGGFRWYQAPVETQVRVIEAFSEISGDRIRVDGLRTWLLRRKHLTHWRSSRATADACYALLISGSEWKKPVENPQISFSGKKVEIPESERGTGYVKKVWQKESVSRNMSSMMIETKAPTTTWGSLYWQYERDLDDVEAAGVPVKLEKRLFLEKERGGKIVLEPLEKSGNVKMGERITVQLILKVSETMDYVHLEDMAVPGFESVDKLSGYRFRDGTGFYKAVKDESMNFFFERVEKGVYRFEYTTIAGSAGEFSSGIATVYSSYAPEFRAHSKAMTIFVGR